MKRKLLTALLAIVMTFACFCGLAACDDDDEKSAKNVDGTYYLYIVTEYGTTKKESTIMKLENGTITGIQDGETVSSGTYKVNGNKIVYNVSGIGMAQELTIVSDGVLLAYYAEDESGEHSATAYYCIEGKTPPAKE